MKVYMYYISESESGNYKNYSLDKESKSLYALTCDKTIAKDFEALRDMTKFTRKKVDMEKDEYKSFANNHREGVLQYTQLLTKKPFEEMPENHNVSLSAFTDKYMMVTTFLEEQSLEESKDDFYTHLRDLLYSFEKGADKLYHPGIFNKKLLSYLNLIQYNEFYFCYLLEKGNANEISSGMSILDVDVRELCKAEKIYLTKCDDSMVPDIFLDEFELFMYMYGHLYA